MIQIDNLEIEQFCREHLDFDLQGALLSIIRLVKPIILKETSTSTINVILQNHVRAIQTTIINASKDTIKDTINENLSERLDTVADKISETHENLEKYLERFKNPGVRGAQTESDFRDLLQNVLPLCEITSVGNKSQKGRGDMTIKRSNCRDVIVDVKDYTSTVPNIQVQKFERDVMMSGNNGILISIFSGIYNKSNFQIDKIGNSIIIYLTCTGYDTHDIESALRVIEYIDSSSITMGIEISLDKLNRIHQLVLINKEKVKMIKSHLSLAQDSLNDLVFDTIKDLLGITTTSKVSSVDRLECAKCLRTYKTKQSLTVHRCKSLFP
jgi:hypothetical protein